MSKLFQMNNSEKTLLRSKLRATCLIKDAFKIFFFKAPKLLTLCAVSCLFIFLSNLLNHKAFHSAHILTLLISIKIIHSDCSLLQASSCVFKKIIPITLTGILQSIVIIFIPAILIAIPSPLLDFLRFSPLPILFKILFTAVFTFLFYIVAHFISRMFFCVFVTITEEKYYMKPFIHSFAYSRDNVLSTFFTLAKVAAFLSVIFLPLIFSLSPSTENLFHSPVVQMILVIPAQFILIIFYLLYHFHKEGFPENIPLTSVQKYKLKFIAWVVGILFLGSASLKYLIHTI